ncbi:MAG: hypothetical protein ACLGIV_00685 [Actinomycetes bacterium]
MSYPWQDSDGEGRQPVRHRDGRRRYRTGDWALIMLGCLLALIGGYLVATAAL